LKFFIEYLDSFNRSVSAATSANIAFAHSPCHFYQRMNKPFASSTDRFFEAISEPG